MNYCEIYEIKLKHSCVKWNMCIIRSILNTSSLAPSWRHGVGDGRGHFFSDAYVLQRMFPKGQAPR